jgi:hypothetical protein
MSHELPSRKSTVVKRMFNQDLAEEYLDTEDEFVAGERAAFGLFR